MTIPFQQQSDEQMFASVQDSIEAAQGDFDSLLSIYVRVCSIAASSANMCATRAAEEKLHCWPQCAATATILRCLESWLPLDPAKLPQLLQLALEHATQAKESCAAHDNVHCKTCAQACGVFMKTFEPTVELITKEMCPGISKKMRTPSCEKDQEAECPACSMSGPKRQESQSQ